MNTNNINLPTVSRITQRAKALRKRKEITHKAALKEISQQYGFSSWALFKEELVNKEQAKSPIAQPSFNFVADEDVDMDEEDYEILDKERSVDLSDMTKERVILNKRELTKVGVEFSVFEPTLTGLKKSILDATQTVRTHFELEDFHHFFKQGQGPEHKVTKQSYLLTDAEETISNSSFYRPITKNGDPRIWFGKLPAFCEAGDQIAIIIHNDSAYLINLSRTAIADSMRTNGSLVKLFLENASEQEFSVATELLAKLKVLAQKPLKAMRAGDTGIGYTLETHLEIAANSSKKPDYKGIEIKSGRGGNNRTTLFAQVPDWDKSPCKRSAEILNKYGYEREDDFKLYCTLTTMRENTQGLSFIYNEAKDELQEWHQKKDLVAIWSGNKLRSRLKEKHAETFWVEASSQLINGTEYFQLLSVTHTKSPVSSQLMPLVASGVITMDHLIKRNGKTNRVSEKGPLFKMNKRDLGLLFPAPKNYSLV
jgi:hypothetical protein